MYDEEPTCPVDTDDAAQQALCVCMCVCVCVLYELLCSGQEWLHPYIYIDFTFISILIAGNPKTKNRGGLWRKVHSEKRV